MREFFSTAAEEAVRSGYLYQKGPCGSTVFNFREAVMKSDRQRIGYHSATDPAAAPAPAPTAAPIGPATKAPVTPPAAPPATTFCVWVQPTKSSAVKAAASTSSFIPIPSSRRECPSARLSESKRSDHWRKLARERQRSKRQRERDGEAWLRDITDAWCLLSDAGMMPDPTIPENDRQAIAAGICRLLLS